MLLRSGDKLSDLVGKNEKKGKKKKISSKKREKKYANGEATF